MSESSATAATTDAALAVLSAHGLRPELLADYQRFLAAPAEHGVPERLLSLCAARVAAIHDCDQLLDGLPQIEAATLAQIRAGDFSSLSDAEQAALVLAERLPLQWHQLTDAEVAVVNEHFGESVCVALMTAIAFVDVNCRLQIVLPAEPNSREH